MADTTPDGAQPSRTRGAASLAQWLTATGRTPADLALILGAQTDTVRRWVAGTRRPQSTKLRTRLAVLTDGAVPADVWRAEAS